MKSHPSLPSGTVILDEVLEAIASALTTHAPERGGLLFGPRGQKLVTLFVADEAAEHHAATYTPSASICKRGPEIEREYGLEYKGVIHSHPGSMDHPSGPDVANARKALQENLHLPCFMMPIVTLGDFEPSKLDSHELLLPGGKLSHWMVPQAVSAHGRELRRERISCLTLWGDLRALAARLPGDHEVARSSMLDIEGISAAVYLLDSADGNWMFAAAAGYPFTPPLVVPPAGIGTTVPLSWDLEIPADRRFRAAVEPLLSRHDNSPVAPPVVAIAANKPIAPGAKERGRRRQKQRLALCSFLALASAVGSFVGTFAGVALSMQGGGSASNSHTIFPPAISLRDQPNGPKAPEPGTNRELARSSDDRNKGIPDRPAEAAKSSEFMDFAIWKPAIGRMQPYPTKSPQRFPTRILEPKLPSPVPEARRSCGDQRTPGLKAEAGIPSPADP